MSILDSQFMQSYSHWHHQTSAHSDAAKISSVASLKKKNKSVKVLDSSQCTWIYKGKPKLECQFLTHVNLYFHENCTI